VFCFNNERLIEGSYVVATGGHGMGKIPGFAHQREKTAELYLTTIVSDPLPPSVIEAIMPAAKGKRLSFSDDTGAVGFGGIDRRGRLAFGNSATGFPARISMKRLSRRLNELFPDLESEYKRTAGKKLQYYYGAQAIACSFTNVSILHANIPSSFAVPSNMASVNAIPRRWGRGRPIIDYHGITAQKQSMRHCGSDIPIPRTRTSGPRLIRALHSGPRS
jgi:hypothetical protein